jgi:hypothetical protein
MAYAVGVRAMNFRWAAIMCTSDAGQQRFTADDFDEMTRDALAGRDSAKLKELHSFVPVCNKRVF